MGDSFWKRNENNLPPPEFQNSLVKIITKEEYEADLALENEQASSSCSDASCENFEDNNYVWTQGGLQKSTHGNFDRRASVASDTPPSELLRQGAAISTATPHEQGIEYLPKVTISGAGTVAPEANTSKHYKNTYLLTAAPKGIKFSEVCGTTRGPDGAYVNKAVVQRRHEFVKDRSEEWVEDVQEELRPMTERDLFLVEIGRDKDHQPYYTATYTGERMVSVDGVLHTVTQIEERTGVSYSDEFNSDWDNFRAPFPQGNFANADKQIHMTGYHWLDAKNRELEEEYDLEEVNSAYVDGKARAKWRIRGGYNPLDYAADMFEYFFVPTRFG